MKKIEKLIKEKNITELRYFISKDKLAKVNQILEKNGFQKLTYPENIVQTLYCATKDLKTSNSSYIRLRRYLRDDTKTISFNNLIIMEVKSNITRKKYRGQIKYRDALSVLHQPNDLQHMSNLFMSKRLDWPQSQNNIGALKIAFRETNNKSLYPTAGTSTYRTHYISADNTRITIDTDIKYVGLFNDNLNLLVPISDEGELCKIEFKENTNPINGKIEALLIELGGRLLKNNEQEIRLKKLYRQHLSRR